MKSSLVLGIIVSCCIMHSSIYSQALIDRVDSGMKQAFDYMQMGDNKKAIQVYEQTIKEMNGLTPEEIEEHYFKMNYVNLAELYYKEGNYKNSLDYYCKFFDYTRMKLKENRIIELNLLVNNEQEGWKAITTKEGEVVKAAGGAIDLYNSKRMKKKNGKIQVWIKEINTGLTPPPQYHGSGIPEEKSTNETADLLKMEFPYSIELHEYDCNQQKSRILKAVFYNKDGTTSETWDNPNPQWEEIIPASAREAMLEFFCKKTAY